MYDLPSLIKLARKDSLLRGLISEEISHEVAKESFRNKSFPKSDRIASVPSEEWAKTQVLCKVASSEPISDLIDSREFPQGSNELAVRVLKKAYPQGNVFTPLESHLIKVAKLCSVDDNILQEFGDQVHFQFFKKALESKSDLWGDFLVVWEDSMPISKVAESIQTMQKEEAKTFRKLQNTKGQKTQKGDSLKEKKKRDRKDNKMQKLTQIMQTFENSKDAKSMMGAINALKAQVPPSKKEEIVNFRRKWEKYKETKKFENKETGNEVKYDSLPAAQRKEYMKNMYVQKIFNLAKSSGGDGSKKEDGKSDGDKGKSEGDKGKSEGDKGKSEGDKGKSDSSGGEGERSWEDTGLDAQTIKEMKAEGKTPDEAAAMTFGEGEGEGEPTSDAEAQVVDSQSEVSFEASPAPAKKSRKQKKYEAKGGQGNWKDNKSSRKASDEDEFLFDIQF